MPDPATYRPAPGSIPETPGVYRFRDPSGRVVYVGKAKNLRARLSSYFQDIAGLHPRTQLMVTTAASVEWTVVATEVEALALEYSWIKEYDPRFNVRYRDDKSYPWLAVTLDEEYPRVQVMRGAKRKGVRYFGPYAHAWAIRETVDLLLRVFPVRTCSSGVFRRARQVGRPCLLGYIDRCSAPCVGRVSAAEHRVIAEDFATFMSGSTTTFVRRLERQMREAAAAQEFERAARLRDNITALQRATERNAVVLADATDADVVGVAEDPLEAALQVFHVRGGRIRGQRGFVVERIDDAGIGELIEALLVALYGEEEAVPVDGQRVAAVPREVLVPALPVDPDQARALQEWLSARRGAQVDLRVPQRGEKRDLLETVTRNAGQSLVLHKTRRGADLSARAQALQELADALGMEQAPLRIECYDVSHLQGTEVVASMVVFEDGLARKSEYRRFAIKTVEGQDDVASIHEVITRRFRRYQEETAIDPTQRPDAPRRFAYPPQLLVVDGGPPQVAAAAAALGELGVPDVTLVGLAKRLEEVWRPDEEHPVVLPRSSQGLYLLQRVRDEAHRFAITYHRQRRSTRMTTSALDGVPGLGPVRRAALLERFGSLRALRRASVEQVAQVDGIGPATAAAVVAALATRPGAPAVNTATGEILGDAETVGTHPVIDGRPAIDEEP
ncbi:MAG: excinuclease ABC subunit UvrC [Actinomycetes bacterium]